MHSLKKFLKQIRFKSSYFIVEDHIVYEVFGSDSEAFFSNQVTSNIKTLSNMSFQESAITDAKGRLVCSFLVLKKGSENFFISFDKKYEKSLIERLNLFLISEDVEFRKIDSGLKIALNHIDKYFYLGELFNGIKCSISISENFNLEKTSPELLRALRFSSGKSLMGIHLRPGELITNTYLAKYAIDYNKGCYPGQETISKIHNNKGASLFPVALVGERSLELGDLKVTGKKIGSVKEVLEIDGKFYHYAIVNRENQIDGKNLVIEDANFTVHNFPLLDNRVDKLVVEVFDEAVECFQNAQDDEAKELLEFAIKLDPTFSDAYESLGVILGREKKFEEAIKIMEKLVEVEPSTVMGRTNLSMYHMQLGDKETAEKYKADATLKQFEQFGIEADKKRAIEEQARQKKLEKEQRESMFRQVLDIDPDDALANFGLGELELERENWENSIDHLKKAIFADKKYSVAYLALGKAFYYSEKLIEAREIFKAGIEIAAKNGDLMPANEMQTFLNRLVD